MKTKNIRLVSCVLTLVALLSVMLCGCGSQSGVSGQSSVSNPSSDSIVSSLPADSSVSSASDGSSANSETATTKALTVTVVYGDKTSDTFELDTDEEFLRGALEEQGLIQGDESEYGLFVKTVNGVTANDANQEWWAISKNGTLLETGVDTTPVADGDSFDFTLTVGW